MLFDINIDTIYRAPLHAHTTPAPEVHEGQSSAANLTAQKIIDTTKATPANVVSPSKVLVDIDPTVRCRVQPNSHLIHLV